MACGLLLVDQASRSAAEGLDGLASRGRHPQQQDDTRTPVPACLFVLHRDRRGATTTSIPQPQADRHDGESPCWIPGRRGWTANQPRIDAVRRRPRLARRSLIRSTSPMFFAIGIPVIMITSSAASSSPPRLTQFRIIPERRPFQAPVMTSRGVGAGSIECPRTAGSQAHATSLHIHVSTAEPAVETLMNLVDSGHADRSPWPLQQPREVVVHGRADRRPTRWQCPGRPPRQRSIVSLNRGIGARPTSWRTARGRAPASWRCGRRRTPASPGRFLISTSTMAATAWTTVGVRTYSGRSTTRRWTITRPSSTR